MGRRTDGQRQGRVVIVTGGSRGIGRETIRLLAGLGYAVVVNYVHDQRTADASVDALLEDHGSAVAIRADVTDDLDVERLLSQTVETFGAVDAVVHTVRGHVDASPATEVAVDELDALWRTTVRATFIVSLAAVRHVRSGGAIVNLVGSVRASVLPAYGVYAISASAIEALTRTLAVDLRERDISVNAVSLDIDKPCAPEKVAELIAFLLSDKGHCTTGQVIQLDSS